MKKLISSVLCISWYVMICAAFSSYAGVVEATLPVFLLPRDEVREGEFYLQIFTNFHKSDLCR